MATTDNTPNWFSDLLQRKFGQKTDARIVRQPVGFDFTRAPFDPSSYYKQLGTFRDISRAATGVVQQEVANRLDAQRQREQAAIQAQLNSAISGIQPGFTYGQGNYSIGNASRGLKISGADRTTQNTLNAINYFAPKFGVSNVGGWRAHGSVPNSDHPKGRAADFMISSANQGSALASSVISDYRRWNVSYVIWNRHIWSPGKGWRPYSGPSPHTDHVHVSFNY